LVIQAHMRHLHQKPGAHRRSVAVEQARALEYMPDRTGNRSRGMPAVLPSGRIRNGSRQARHSPNRLGGVNHPNM
jgi:hypothetical protein